ncbi:hypothetical protein [Legionella sp. km772]|uniref:hypothetical protein n=1 Tax=Legionella sp. km772 TaxID=2498111 RepID=UPI000F8CA9B6|nr:hypothetical protein [Legionella sp. km772]RUR07957.1 hypothetical protein ELY15_11580 [Legionella sp. km772]
MPRTFFPQAKAAAVDKLLENINVLLSSATMDLAELNHYQQQLEKHLEHPQDISARTIRRMRKTLAELNSYANEDEAMDVIRISSECCIQIPSPTDLAYMAKMPAGGAEDQQSRLTHMSELVLGSTSLPVKTTDEFEFNKNWQALFKLIDLGKKAFALRKVEQMAETEPLLQLILTIHPIKYLQTIINHCIEAQARGYKRLNSDIVSTPKTFELLIKDLALSLNPASPLYFSFGLPSHHAFNDLGSGFCLFNSCYAHKLVV